MGVFIPKHQKGVDSENDWPLHGLENIDEIQEVYEMNYTHNWNQQFINNTKEFKNLDLALEIGCFEGLTSNYICDKLLSENGKLICVDPLENTYLSEKLTAKDEKNNKTVNSYFDGQYDRFIENTKHQERISLWRMLSSVAIPRLLKEYKGLFGLIYVDGDHRAKGVYNDGVGAFSLCKEGGIIIFDDYQWGKEYRTNRPKTGIDKFLSEYVGRYRILHMDYQVVIMKL